MNKTVHHEAKILVRKRPQTKTCTSNWFQLWQVPLGKNLEMMFRYVTEKLGTFSGVKEGLFELRPERDTGFNLCCGQDVLTLMPLEAYIEPDFNSCSLNKGLKLGSMVF